MKKYLQKLYEKAVKVNHKNIFNLLRKNSNAKFLDLGCDDGNLTMKLAKVIGTTNVYGVEIVDEKIKIAEEKGIKIKKFDLNNKFNFEDNFFDVIHANQVIEHLYDTDNFVSEIYRILKPNGYAVISTENLSSWHNIFALILGFQPFSMTNFSSKGNIGNPFALWKDKKSDDSFLSSWQHVRLFSYYGLKDLFKKFGFKVKKINTAGYYPLPSFFSNIDKIHGHLISIKLIK